MTDRELEGLREYIETTSRRIYPHLCADDRAELVQLTMLSVWRNLDGVRSPRTYAVMALKCRRIEMAEAERRRPRLASDLFENEHGDTVLESVADPSAGGEIRTDIGGTLTDLDVEESLKKVWSKIARLL